MFISGVSVLIVTTGIDMNTYRFSGNEQLQINFVSALAAGVTIDVYAHMATVVEVSANAVKKLSL